MKKRSAAIMCCLICLSLLSACGQDAYIDREETVFTETFRSEIEETTDEQVQPPTEEMLQVEELPQAEETGILWVLKSYTFYHNGEEWNKVGYSYNEIGQIAEEIWYSGGMESSRDIYYYDSNNILEEIVTYYGDEAKWSQTYSYTYDTAGNLVEKIEYENGDEEYKYTYDVSGNIVTQECFHTGETVQYTYDSKGDLVKEVEYKDGEERVRINYLYSYNADGVLIEKKTFQKAVYGEWTYKDSYTYDECGNLIENLCYTYDENDGVTENRALYEYIQIKVEPEWVDTIKSQQNDLYW